MTGEKQGYYGDYQRSPRSDIARSLSSGFVYQGEPSAFRGGKRGEPSGHLAPTAFINFLQNHDQIGNRALGDRLESNADARAIEAALADPAARAVTFPCCSWARNGARQAPFPFFCDFGGDLADAVRKGRRVELAWAYAEYGDEVPDALAPSTCDSAVLDWDERDDARGTKAADAGARTAANSAGSEIVPRLAGAAFGEGTGGRRWPADGPLADGRWRHASPARQPVGPGHQPCARMSPREP